MHICNAPFLSDFCQDISFVFRLNCDVSWQGFLCLYPVWDLIISRFVCFTIFGMLLPITSFLSGLSPFSVWDSDNRVLGILLFFQRSLWPPLFFFLSLGFHSASDWVNSIDLSLGLLTLPPSSLFYY